MLKDCNIHIQESLELARQLTILSDEGLLVSEDDGCQVLYGVIRDCAYKIRTLAEQEKRSHIEKSIWK